MNPNNQSIINAVGGPQIQPQTASGSMNTTVNPGESAPGVQFGSPSPVNNNPNYARTIMDYFNHNALAGPQPFQQNPLQEGQAGNNASIGGAGWNSFMPNDPYTMMQNLMQMIGNK